MEWTLNVGGLLNEVGESTMTNGRKTRTSTGGPSKRSRENSPADTFDEYMEKIESDKNLSITSVAKGLKVINDSLANLLEDKHECQSNALEDKLDRILQGQEQISGQIQSLNERVSGHDDAINDCRNDMRMFKDRLAALEGERLSGNLIIKNLNLHMTAMRDKKEETGDQTVEVVSDLFSRLGITRDLCGYYAKRFKPLTNGKGPPLIQVRLDQPADKMRIFTALKNAKLTDVSVNNEYPRILKEDVKRAERMAFEIRQADKTTRTRVAVRGGKVFLLKRGKDDSRYIQHKLIT